MSDIIRNDVLMMLSQHLTEHSGNTGCNDFPSLCKELGDRNRRHDAHGISGNARKTGYRRQ